MDIQFFGACQEVTGSCFLIQVADHKILIECGLFQGSKVKEERNFAEFPFDPSQLSAVILSHAHLDHSGRLPILIENGYKGPIYTHAATADLCEILLADAAYINEKETIWENKKRQRRGLDLVSPLYDRASALKTQKHFKPLEYNQKIEILPGVQLNLKDAGHILGSSIIELYLQENGHHKKIVFSGDLGHKNAPILNDPETITDADLVVMESTYGDRLHRSWDDTWIELGEILSDTNMHSGNIIIPAFTIGRTQELLFALKENYDKWGIGNWEIFLDSPMAIKATTVYSKYHRLYDAESKTLSKNTNSLFDMPNLHYSEDTESSMKINQIQSGAIIIAGSGMCTGGRIKHHLKHNLWREKSHIVIVGFQAQRTLGRALVDGSKLIQLWGEDIIVKAKIHTVGGLSAHADQQGLLDWYGNFDNSPPVILVHGENDAMDALETKIKTKFNSKVTQAKVGQKIQI